MSRIMCPSHAWACDALAFRQSFLFKYRIVVIITVDCTWFWFQLESTFWGRNMAVYCFSGCLWAKRYPQVRFQKFVHNEPKLAMEVVFLPTNYECASMFEEFELITKTFGCLHQDNPSLIRKKVFFFLPKQVRFRRAPHVHYFIMLIFWWNECSSQICSSESRVRARNSK